VRAFLRARDRRATITRRVLARSDLDANDLTTIDLSVKARDSLAGRTLAELNLPHEAIVTSLVRNGRAMIPRGRVVLQPGDQLQITTLASARDLVMAQVTSGPRTTNAAVTD
jgi:Trk K+ transport system NAD-binding subunit